MISQQDLMISFCVSNIIDNILLEIWFHDSSVTCITLPVYLIHSKRRIIWWAWKAIHYTRVFSAKKNLKRLTKAMVPEQMRLEAVNSDLPVSPWISVGDNDVIILLSS